MQNYYLFMQDNDGNTMINLKNIGNGMMIASFVLLVALSGQYQPVPDWVVPALFVGGFVLLIVNGSLDKTDISNARWVPGEIWRSLHDALSHRSLELCQLKLVSKWVLHWRFDWRRDGCSHPGLLSG